MPPVVLVCRMSSSRLPGKSLMPFGERPLLLHIVERIAQAGLARRDIIVCTSTAPEDRAILDAANEVGCRTHAGSLDNVSRRILGAARQHGAERFCLVLGDNPWIDPEQIRQLAAQGDAADYAVTATPELAYQPEDERYFPIGTRLQRIRTAFMAERLAALDSPDVQEHASRLFACLPNGTRSAVLFPRDGLPRADIGGLNISINTRADYDAALRALTAVGDPLAPTQEITRFYLSAA